MSESIINIRWDLFISQVATFLVALFIVWKFAWGPIVAMMRGRQEKIKETIDSVERMREDVKKLEDDYNLRLQQIQEESTKLINQAKQEAGHAADQIINQAKQDAEEQRSRMQEQLKRDRELFAAQLRSETVALAMAVAQKVIRDSEAAKLPAERFEQILGAIDKEYRQG
jgi:F-type H+-transporting ATPase subunit b